MDVLHWILLGLALTGFLYGLAVAGIAHYKINAMKFDYSMWVADAKCEIEKAQAAMAEAQKIKVAYEMAGEALEKKGDYYPGG